MHTRTRMSMHTEPGTSPRPGFEPIDESLAKKISAKITNMSSPAAVSANTATMQGAENRQPEAAKEEDPDRYLSAHRAGTCILRARTRAGTLRSRRCM